MKEKIKVGDIIRYNGTDFFGDYIQIIGYVIDTSINNRAVPIGYYRVVLLKENKKRSLRNGKVVYISGYYGSFVKLY